MAKFTQLFKEIQDGSVTPEKTTFCGDLTSLQTTAQDNLVNAINEVKNSSGSSGGGLIETNVNLSQNFGTFQAYLKTNANKIAYVIAEGIEIGAINYTGYRITTSATTSIQLQTSYRSLLSGRFAINTDINGFLILIKNSSSDLVEVSFAYTPSVTLKYMWPSTDGMTFGKYGTTFDRNYALSKRYTSFKIYSYEPLE